MIGVKHLFSSTCRQIATQPTPMKIQKFGSTYQGKQNILTCQSTCVRNFSSIQKEFSTIPKIQKFDSDCQDKQNIFTCQIICTRSISSIQKEFSRGFHNLQPRGSNCINFPILSKKRIHRDLFNTFPRNFWFSRKKNDSLPRKKKTPKLILLQNPLTWLMIKIDFSILRHIWDPSFQEKDFKFGTKQAISRVTQVISDGQLKDLNGLLTKAARMSLLRELDRNWNEKQRALLVLNRDDIQISSPRKVYFIRIADKKFCDVDMAFLALKWAPINSIEALIFTEIFARFHREYTPHSIPEWTIAFFKVTRFQVLQRQK